MGKLKEKMVTLKNKQTGETILTTKNKKGVQRKLKFKKFSKKLRKRIDFTESK